MSTGILDQALILLDSQSTVHVFDNKELLTDIKVHPEGKTLQVFTNGGHMDSQMVGCFGDIHVWYNPNSIANILSLALIVDSFRVTLDSRVEHAFTLWLDDSAHIKFKKFNHLFVYNWKHDKVIISNHMSPAGAPWQLSLLQTVPGNERMY
jgi:hypothetical protein